MAVAKFLTVIEASSVLRIDRTVAYAETRRFRGTGGREGIPCVEIGGQVRVPTAELERLAGCPIDEASIAARSTRGEPLGGPPAPATAVAGAPPTSPRRARVSRRAEGVPTLPFAS